MQGAILYATKYGSTAQYAEWISETTGLPAFDVRTKTVAPEEFEFLVLMSPVLYYKLLIARWVQKHLPALRGKPIVMVTVSGAPPGPKLDAWVGKSLPADFLREVEHVALQGRQIPAELTWFDRAMLIIAAWKNPDPVASQEERKGFDYMNKESIAPVVELAQKYQARDKTAVAA